MTDKFLKAKHWQLFLLILGIPIVFQLILMGSIMSNIGTETNPEPALMLNYLRFFPIVMIIFVVVFFGWFWSIAIGLQSKVPKNVKMKVKKFKIFFFIPIVYMLFLIIFMEIQMNGFSTTEPSGSLVTSLATIIVTLHIFSMFCIFYALYFVAKTFKTVELQREVSFSDFAGEFFMIWFYPIGIWIIQPKINKMMMENNTITNTL